MIHLLPIAGILSSEKIKPFGDLITGRTDLAIGDTLIASIAAIDDEACSVLLKLLLSHEQ